MVARGCDYAVVRYSGGELPGYVAHDSAPVHFPEPGVDFRDLGGKLLAVALGETSHHVQPAHITAAAVGGIFKYGVDRLLLGIAYEAACIDHNDLRRAGVLRRIVTHSKTGITQLAEQTLAVHKIFGAAERHDINVTLFHWLRRSGIVAEK